MKKPFAAGSLAVSVLLALASAQAQAQTSPPSPYYAEIGLAALSLKETFGGVSLKASPRALTGVFGYQAMPNLAFEGLLGLGAGTAGVKVDGAASGMNVKIGNTLGFFIKPSVAVTDSIDLFARAGWLRTTLKVTEGNLSESSNGNSMAYGFGANYKLTNTSYIQANWMSYYNKDGVKIDGMAVAYGMRF